MRPITKVKIQIFLINATFPFIVFIVGLLLTIEQVKDFICPNKFTNPDDYTIITDSRGNEFINGIVNVDTDLFTVILSALATIILPIILYRGIKKYTDS